METTVTANEDTVVKGLHLGEGTLVNADDLVLKVLMYPQRGYFDDVTITRPPSTSP